VRSHSPFRHKAATDSPHLVHSIPIQSIATNGPSLVHKVRFVASTLLDAVRKVDSAPASAARAHAYLWDFLSVLSEIERNYVYVFLFCFLLVWLGLIRPGFFSLDDDRDEARIGGGVVS
jgi:hypothetical protein